MTNLPIPRETIDMDVKVRTANKLLHAQWKLSNQQQRLVYIIASQVRISDTDFREYNFQSGDLMDALGITSREPVEYRRLRNLVKSLMGDVLEFEGEDGTIIQAAWLAQAQYFKGGRVAILIAPALKPYYIDLIKTGRFTEQPLKLALGLRGDYALRLHGLFREKAFTANKAGVWKVELSLKEIRFMFALEDKYLGKSGPKDIRVYVIAPAVDEVSEKSDLDVRYEVVKNGRGISGFLFNVRYKKKGEKLAQTQAELDYEALKKTLKGKRLKEFEIEWEAIQQQTFISDGLYPPYLLQRSAEETLLKKYQK